MAATRSIRQTTAETPIPHILFANERAFRIDVPDA
jgi:hypothetical protein